MEITRFSQLPDIQQLLAGFQAPSLAAISARAADEDDES